MKETLEALVYQALGEASMCWSERPKGEFDGTNAIRIGQELMEIIKQHETMMLADDIVSFSYGGSAKPLKLLRATNP